MQAARLSSRAVKAIAAGSKQSRSLSMTGPATFSSLLTSDRPVPTLPRELDDAKRPVAAVTEAGPSVRHFNTSRTLKAPNDSSTIDFSFMPDFDPDLGSSPVGIRVPILPTNNTPNPSYNFAAAVAAADAEEEVMLPMIHTVSAHVHAPAAMSEVHDNNTIDFQGMAFQVASNLTRPVEEGASMARQIWGDLVDDVLGPKAART